MEIRHVGVEDIEAYDTSKLVTYLESPASVARRLTWRAAHWNSDRSWAAVADGRFVGTLQTVPRSLSVPGPAGTTTDISADALTGVSVAGTHRRQGLLRGMLGQSLAAARERGDAVSILIAAEYAIYGRFGYAPASYWSDIQLDRRRAGARLRVSATGGLRQLDDDQMAAVAPGVFAAARRQRAGQIDRPDSTWEIMLSAQLRPPSAAPPVYIAHEGPEGVDGLLIWHPTSEWGLLNGAQIRVDQLFATNQDAYTALWGYVCGLDAVDEVLADERPVDEPVRWLLTDARSWQTRAVVDAMWVRLLDVPAALGARCYQVADSLVLQVVDDDTGAYAAGRFLLDGGPDGARCTPTSTATPDLVLSQRALAAAYLGHPSLAIQQSAGLVDELTAGAVRRADLMFTTPLAPWLATAF